MKEAILLYKDQFTRGNHNDSFFLVDLIPKLISDEDNILLNKEPTMDEIKQVIFALNGSSSSGPNSLTRLFY